jgi:uncharacterized protein YbjT (DUF2867 family)
MERGIHRGTVLVIGAQGFLGGFITAALLKHGYRVLRGVRSPRAGPSEERRCDLAAMSNPEDWIDALAGMDVIVNAAGILREAGAQTFEAVHLRGPIALAQACVGCGIKRFVQISALGDPQDGEFVASKHSFDAALLALPVNALVLRPSVVYAAEGSYGGTSLLRALAALPFGIWVPGRGDWRFQPLAAQDLAEIVVRAIGSDANGMFEVAGPVAISLRDYQRQWRQWLRISDSRVIQIPQSLASAQVYMADVLSRGPMSATIWRMLRRGNVTAPDAFARIADAFGYSPRSLEEVLSQHPSQVQDRWHARLYFLAPLLRVALTALWVISGVAGLLAPADGISSAVGAVPHAFLLAKIAGCVDFSFALWLVSGWRARWALAGMMLSVAIYTIVFSVLSPALWLAPLGGLAKNLVILPALAVMWVLSERR